MRIALALFLALIAHPVLAQDVPLPRDSPQFTRERASQSAVPVPRPRPGPAMVAPDANGETVPEVPLPRVYQAACPAVLMGQVEAGALPPIAENMCVVRSPLAVAALLVNGRMVPLASAAILTCAMAGALRDWAEAIDGYLVARENTRIARLLTGTSYACRPRNNAEGADVSEHGFGNAIDVVGFELEDGRTMALPGGWSEPLSPAGRLLRFAHDAGCAHFTTTLGPEANALHADHLHFDLGCHGERCVARLCE